MIILLPPSEGKAPEGGSGDIASMHPELVKDMRGVLEYQKGLSAEERMKLYGVKDDAKAKRFFDLNRNALKAPCLIALERYTGVVYQYLGYAALNRKGAARDRIRIVSGLFGLISGGTAIPDYKMPMNTWLARYWRERNTERLKETAGKKKVLSLLPQAYQKAINVEDAIHIEFRTQGGKKPAGHFGKAVKGKFVRFVIENNVKTVDGFAAFEEDGYRFDGRNFVQG